MKYQFYASILENRGSPLLFSLSSVYKLDEVKINKCQIIQRNNKRIAKNTFFLTIRMIFVTLVYIYTSRVILNALGVVDYGIYNVIYQ